MSDHISNWISKYQIIRGGINGTITQLESQHIGCCWTELQHIRVDDITGRNWMDCQKWTEKWWCNLRSSPITMAQFYTMGINELKSTIVRNRWITGQWCIPLTNARQPTNNENEHQGALVQSNKCEWMSWSRTLERIYQSGGNDESPLSIVKSLPLMTANPKVLKKRI